MTQQKSDIIKRITASLSDAVARYPLVALIAPVGWGKTTAARELIRASFNQPGEIDARPGPWPAGVSAYYMSAHAGEASPDYLIQRHLLALASESSALGKLIRHGVNPFNLPERAKIMKWVHRYTTDHPMLLVIDGCQHLSDPRYADFFERIVNEDLPGLRILLLSRFRPALPLEEMRVKNQCRIFGPELLAFRPDEVEFFFRSKGLIDPAFARRAWEVSEGWAAALILEMDEYRRSGRHAEKDEFYRLLDHAVFSRFNEQEKNLLLSLSVLDEFSEPRAMALTRDRSVLRVIRQLAADRGFIGFDPERRVYRFHKLFRSFCGFLLATAPAGRIDLAELRRRARLLNQEALEAEDAASPSFTRREWQIIEQLLKGLNNQQIAEVFNIQRVTVTKTLGNIYRKLGVKNRAQAISLLLTGGLGGREGDGAIKPLPG